MVLGLCGYIHSWRVVVLSQALSFGTLIVTWVVWDQILNDQSQDWVPFISDVGDADSDYPWVYWMFAWFYTLMSALNAFGIWMIYVHVRIVLLSLLPLSGRRSGSPYADGLLVDGDPFDMSDDEEVEEAEGNISGALVDQSIEIERGCCCGPSERLFGLPQVLAWLGVVPLLVGFVAMGAMGLTAHVCTSCNNAVHLTFAGVYFFCSVFTLCAFALLLGAAYFLKAKSKETRTKKDYWPFIAWTCTGGVVTTVTLLCALTFGALLLTDLDDAWKALFEWLTVSFIHVAFATFGLPMATFGKTKIVLIIDDYYHVKKVPNSETEALFI
mmetsp:Transcript_14048/g.55343  ORF Transcript_14048/g.55343 Transcript_14048/m.55343 type:complete len:327 (+) Transcript_14048:44-1024(+)|eukprot:CAMPEP_0114615188 /NCGR_PEP_ID=MMETSP0168-20121206/6037_1 /TAXON_ID=95228 ORGANISM="Vannella sp., Strain DIVA3 517/6/12" /NCGR_SAMPLE_ID=MMETSP0168 /ASSEMBLY_ACC=CAM_ASM_000044 /LENGTH=326 /DNA_ID=CAMNT_0001826253 /DNA_START=33 /DNA_END=1013 /DNA_ORIENTATION=-